MVNSDSSVVMRDSSKGIRDCSKGGVECHLRVRVGGGVSVGWWLVLLGVRYLRVSGVPTDKNSIYFQQEVVAYLSIYMLV